MFRSGSPRPLSKPRNTFALFTTPMSRAVRPLCPIRRLARRPTCGIDISDVRGKWEAHINEKPRDDIRAVCGRLRALYEKGRERYKLVHLNDLFSIKSENDDAKTLDDFMPKFEEKILNENEKNLTLRYPKLQEDSSEFYARFTHTNLSIMKKRPYESNESSNEGKNINISRRKRN